jgi:hypothetical protein
MYMYVCIYMYMYVCIYIAAQDHSLYSFFTPRFIHSSPLSLLLVCYSFYCLLPLSQASQVTPARLPLETLAQRLARKASKASSKASKAGVASSL